MERVVRGFKLLEVIGRGGMAVVYKAIQTSVNRIVAVKELHKHFLSDQDFIERFKREATAAANLHHENIIIIYDYGAEEEEGNIISYIIAMEYVEGRSLKGLMEGGKKIPIPVAMNIAVQICRGLEHAHNKGVIHRDIKPANIIISYEGYVKIADFGLAQSSHLPSMTVTGTTLGTPAYMSPEQVAGNRKLDGRTDIFSLGVVMYEMVTGQKPFMAETYPAIMTKILTHHPEPPSKLNPSVPEDFSGIIQKCLAKDVDKRYANVSELLKELNYCAEKNEIRIEHGLVREFVKDPDEFEKKLNSILVKQYLDKGLYFMNLGFEKIDDAIQMFTRVLHIQPDNTVARQNLERLKAKKERLKLLEEQKKAHVQPEKEEERIEEVAEERIPEKKPEQVKEKKPVVKPEVMKEKKGGWWKYVIAGMLLIFAGIGGVIFYSSTFKGKTEKPVVSPSLPEQVETRSKKGSVSAPAIKPPKKVHPPRVSPEKRPEKKVVSRTPSVKPKPEPKVPSKPKRVQKKLTSIPPPEKKEVKYSYLMVIVNPWADIYIDGKFVKRTPLKEPIKIPVGEHTLKLVNPGYTPFERKMKFKQRPRDKPLTIKISLEPIGAR